MLLFCLRTERPRKTKIGTEVAHVTRDSDITFKLKRSKVKVTRPLYSPPCWRVRQLQRWAWERVGLLAVGNCCYVAVCSVAKDDSAPTVGGEGRGHTVEAARLQVVGQPIRLLSGLICQLSHKNLLAMQLKKRQVFKMTSEAVVASNN